jgi:CAAX prenyl protease-like protein
MSSKPTSPPAKTTGSDSLAWCAPFVVFVALRWLPIRPEWLAPLRFAMVALTLVVFSRRVIRLRPIAPVASLALGAAVFVVWIAPDLLWPHYRDLPLFDNSMVGAAHSSLPVRLRSNLFFIAVRVVESGVLVPIVEELFWRGWLMRWLIRSDFLSVPPGTYTAFSFWSVVVLFAAEHGPYWDVGLLAGVAYCWCMLRTRSLADCIVAHSVTNAALAVYVLVSGQWQYWL